MKFGICGPVSQSPAIAAAGWDYVEENVQSLLQGELPDGQWTGAERASESAVPVIAANCLVPGHLKITGSSANAARLRDYMAAVCRRAETVGIKTLVFGSGGARQIPDGFDRVEAKQQILRFLRDAAPLAGRHGVTLVVEPLNSGECNVINSVAEATEYVRAIDHPAVQCLVDSFHFWLEDEPLKQLEAAMPWIAHVHLADKDGRVAPGLSGSADYVPFFRVLKRGGYAGDMSFEGAAMPDFPAIAPKVLRHVKAAWDRA